MAIAEHPAPPEEGEEWFVVEGRGDGPVAKLTIRGRMDELKALQVLAKAMDIVAKMAAEKGASGSAIVQAAAVSFRPPPVA